MTFASLVMPPAAVRWELSGPAGVHLALIAAQSIGSGCTVESIEPGRRYRIEGPDALLTALAEQVAKVEGYSLAHEAPPEGIRCTTAVEPARNFRRTNVIHGPAFGPVARAIDLGLRVGTVGVLRWSITGPSAVQAAWLADVQGVTTDRVLEQWGVAPEQIAAEDASLSIAVTVPVTVTLPARRTTTQSIKRDRDGNITGVVSIEADDEVSA
jgi:hypothetical protein